jgi:hypothetical protein
MAKKKNGHHTSPMVDGYASDVDDSTYVELGQVQPSPSTVGNGYPSDFQGMMPGYALSAVNVSPDGDPGGWTAPEAYAWGSEDALTTNPQVYGTAGARLGNSFAFGCVESNTVENFELNGWQSQFNPLRYGTTNWGDVGFNDFSGILGGAIAADTYDYPAEYDMMASVVSGI